MLSLSFDEQRHLPPDGNNGCIVLASNCDRSALLRSLLFVLVVASLVGGSVSAVSATAVPTEQAVTSLQDNDTAANETTRHEHPDDATGEGDDEALADWLTNELGQSLGDSTIQLSEGQYEQAESIVGDEYNDRLDQYVDVNGDVDGSEDRTAPETFEQAQQTQRQFVTSVQTYRETREEYEQARANGDDQRARELARELNDIAENTSQSGQTLDRTYQNISETSDVDLGDERDTVETIRRDIEDTQSEIRETEFLNTQLDVTVDDPGSSFLEPAEIDGTVVDEEGSPVADQRIRIQIDGRTVGTTTDANGAFELTYRPALLSVDADAVALELVPAADSVYLPSNTTVPVISTEITQVTPEIDLSNATTTAAFGDTVSVTGRVHAEDVPADGIPVIVTVDGQYRTSTVRTDANGEFGIETPLPAGVAAGEQNLSVVYPRDDRALASASTTRSLTVEPTPTDLSLTTEETPSGAVTAAGRLTTAGGDPIANQPVRLAVNGRTVDTVETNNDGRFQTVVNVSAAAPPTADTVQLAAVYAQNGTNLEDARAETQIALTLNTSSSLLPLLWRLFGGLLALVGVGLLVLSIVSGDTRRPTIPAALSRRFGGDDADDRSDPTDDATAMDDEPDTGDQPPAVELPAPEVSARQELEAGHPDRATTLAYELTRPRLSSALTDEGARTHWEFYSAWQAANGDDGQSAALRRLTEAYEHAVFAPDPVTSDDAADAIHAATALVSEPDEQ